MLMKRWSCGYRSLKSCLHFNNCRNKGMYKKIPYNKGVCMDDIKKYLDTKVDSTVYQLVDPMYVSSNMLVHTYHKNKGHYMYVPYVGKKYSLIYDSRFLFPYKRIKTKKIGRYIDFSKEVIVLKINDEIDYNGHRLTFMTEVIFIMLFIKMGIVSASLIVMLHLITILTIKNSEK